LKKIVGGRRVSLFLAGVKEKGLKRDWLLDLLLPKKLTRETEKKKERVRD